MNNLNSILIILVVSLVTIVIRFLPFVIFKSKAPNIINYLGKKLPYAIMAMLVVYCLKDTNISNLDSLLPTIIGVVSVIIIHLSKRNILISIVLGTTIYMLVLHLF